jgi:hypothetical protein
MAKPGALSTLQTITKHQRAPDPEDPEWKARGENAIALQKALTKRFGKDKWTDEMRGGPPKPGDRPNGKYVGFALDDDDEDSGGDDDNSGSSHKLDREDKVKEKQPIFGSKHATPPPRAIFAQCGAPMLMHRERQEAERAEYVAKVRSARAKVTDLVDEPTLDALNRVLIILPGEDDAAYSKRIYQSVDYLRRLNKVNLRANNDAIAAVRAEIRRTEDLRAKKLEYERLKADRQGNTVPSSPIEPRPLKASQILSVQQMYRAMHRGAHIKLDAPMAAALKDYLEQFPESIGKSPAALARSKEMMPATIAACRKANDADLAASKKKFEAGNGGVWKPTEAAILVRTSPKKEAIKQEAPTTPTRQTRSGSVTTPAAPKKPTTKKATSSKPAGVKKAATPTKSTKTKAPTTPTNPFAQRRSARISAKDH